MAKIINKGLIKEGDPILYQCSLIAPIMIFPKKKRKKTNKDK